MCAERHRAGGQALVELLVAAIALVPLYFGIAWIAKVIDVRQATIAAARSTAFECTVRPQACGDVDGHPELARDLRHRFFASDRLALRSDASGDPAERNAFWTDRRGEPLLERYDDVSVAVAPGRFDSPLAFAGSLGERSFPGAVRLLSEAGGPGRFGLAIDGGLVEASVEARLSRTRPADGWVRRLAAVPLSPRSRLAVLTDAWNASGPYGDAPDSVQSRVEAGARLPVVEPAIDAGWLAVRALLAVAAASRFEPDAAALAWHGIDVDLVPADRIGGDAPRGAPVAPAEQP